jgi:multidrug transporter EmrE-like cation transporter
MRKSHKIMARILMIVACIVAVVFFFTRSLGSTEMHFGYGIGAGILLLLTVLVFKKTR